MNIKDALKWKYRWLSILPSTLIKMTKILKGYNMKMKPDKKQEKYTNCTSFA